MSSLDPLDLRFLDNSELRKRIYDLERWKAEAMEVLNGWDAVWRAAGCPGPLGAPQHENVVAEIDRLRGHSIILNRVSWDLHMAMGLIPAGSTTFEGDIEMDMPMICELVRKGVEVAKQEHPSHQKEKS